MGRIKRVPRRRQVIGYLLGLTGGLLAIGLLLLPAFESLHARGPWNTGHEELRCKVCHRPAPGTLRQQLQAGARYLVGLRATPADIGLKDVANRECLACHDRPNDRHPVFRFVEPRFRTARAAIAPHCASPVIGSTVRARYGGDLLLPPLSEDTRLKNDPLDVAHATLIAADRWTTCLGCHDFHGNHVMETATKLARAHPPRRITQYFNGGASPYPKQRHYEAKRGVGDE